jgi:hypothetical protein
MKLFLPNNKHVGTKIEWKHVTNSNQLYRPEASLTESKVSPADKTSVRLKESRCRLSLYKRLDLCWPQ